MKNDKQGRFCAGTVLGQQSRGSKQHESLVRFNPKMSSTNADSRVLQSKQFFWRELYDQNSKFFIHGSS